MQTIPFDSLAAFLSKLQQRETDLQLALSKLGTAQREHNTELSAFEDQFPKLGEVEEVPDVLLTHEQFTDKARAYKADFDALPNPTTEPEVAEAIAKNKAYVENMLVLTNQRWRSIIEYIHLWQTERKGLDKELSLLNTSFQELSDSRSSLSEQDWKSRLEGLFDQYGENLAEVEKRMNAEEAQVKNLNDLIAVRQRFLYALKNFKS